MASFNPRYPVHYRTPSRPTHKPAAAHLSLGPVRAPRALVFYTLFTAALLIWSSRLGLFRSFAAATSAALPFASAAPRFTAFSYGPVKIDRVVRFAGEGEGRGGPQRSERGMESSERFAGEGNESEEKQSGEGKMDDGVHDGIAVAGEREDVTETKNAENLREDKPVHIVSNENDLRRGEPVSVKTEIPEDAPSQAQDANDVVEESDTNASYNSNSNVGDASGSDAERRQQDPHATTSEEMIPPLRKILNFSKNTAINFMHFHKTGGVSFKSSLHKFYADKFKASGDPVVIRDACYVRKGASNDSKTPSFALWRCDWDPIRRMNEENRNKHDLVFGHQFWGNGAGELLNKRDLRTFTILRHPFDRKVSFYYHFFVREVGRKESDVTFDEIRSFLLHNKLVIDADLGRDLGPNYMAGRLLSDGEQGFVGNKSYRYYAVEQDRKQGVAEQVLKLIRDYVFVGLQTQSPASKCMLRKMMELFNEVHGVDNTGMEQIDKAAALNRGSYLMSAADIWEKLSLEDRVLFDRMERVDLTIYEEGERLFRKHVELFRCSDRLIDKQNVT